MAVYPCDTQITDCQSDTPDLNVCVGGCERGMNIRDKRPAQCWNGLQTISKMVTTVGASIQNWKKYTAQKHFNQILASSQ